MDCAKENKKRFFRKGGQSKEQKAAEKQDYVGPREIAQRKFDNNLMLLAARGVVRTDQKHLPQQQPQQQQHTQAPPPDYDYENVLASSRNSRTLQDYNLQNLQDLKHIRNFQKFQHLHTIQLDLDRQHQRQKEAAAAAAAAAASRPTPGSSRQFFGPNAGAGAAAKNTGSLDETEMHRNQQIQRGCVAAAPAPRRARSAERFDGMRIQHQQQQQKLPGTELLSAALMRGGKGAEEILRNYTPQQLLMLRQMEITAASLSSSNSSGAGAGGGGGGGSPQYSSSGSGGKGLSGAVGAGPVNVSHQPPTNTPGLRRPIPVMGVMPGIAAAQAAQAAAHAAAHGKYKSYSLDSGFPIPSPPPSYNAAINEGHLQQQQHHHHHTNPHPPHPPPPYHQAMAAGSGGMKQSASRGMSAAAAAAYDSRTAAAAMGMGRSLSSAGNNPRHGGGGPPRGMRTVASTPALLDGNRCNCHDCQQVRDDLEDTENNDAVYMESQAFLMHEIMTDGMAFCSIV